MATAMDESSCMGLATATPMQAAASKAITFHRMLAMRFGPERTDPLDVCIDDRRPSSRSDVDSSEKEEGGVMREGGEVRAVVGECG